jgi:PPK2 family polyphosphate:nucleotide phosphotransferase
MMAATASRKATTPAPHPGMDELWKLVKRMRVKEGSKVSLKKYATRYEGSQIDRSAASEIMEEGIRRLARMQDMLYADDKHSVLVVLQAMDTAGKDGAIKHIMSGLNPQGVKVTPFKKPSDNELDHDFLWRHYSALPARGEIGIFNRSHYENVLVSRVHPSILATEKLPGIDPAKGLPASFWKERYHTIRQFEHILSQSGTIIVKFFLHLSKEEQRRRLIARIDDEEKNWKFSSADLAERAYWEHYQRAYEQAISATSTSYAPWYVIPADDKWFSRLSMAAILYRTVESLNLSYPSVNKEQRAALQRAKEELIKE